MTTFGVILYGPPASGKDTITAALTDLRPDVVLYERCKVGPGRTAGYTMLSAEELRARQRQERIIWLTERYGATYAIDRRDIGTIAQAGAVPVVHVGQVPAVGAIELGARSVNRWIVVDLQLPRDVAAARIAARATGDDSDRLVVFDRTPALPDRMPDLVIRTDLTSAVEAAGLIAAQLPNS